MNLPSKEALVRLLKHLLDNALKRMSDPGDGLDVTIGADEGGQWSYQTGDNSFAGGAYHYPHWAVVTLHLDSNLDSLADDIRDQLAELMAQ